MTDSDSSLIHLSGRDFRAVEVACAGCYWRGQAGELAVPATGLLSVGVVYACPACGSDVATHEGLSQLEIDEELRQIRAELAQELRDSYRDPNNPTGRVVEPDFESVRALIKGIA